MRSDKILITIAPAIVRLGLKAVRFSRNGYTKDEIAQLGEDLLVLALSVLDIINKQKEKTDAES
jgi:hypothetical protein